jgi:hypothetical protein
VRGRPWRLLLPCHRIRVAKNWSFKK